ncbi:Hsp20/alpha crystallin family protein [Chloroflexota bacterium]
MTKLVRWNPYREMMSMLNSMDRLVDSENLGAHSHAARPTAWGLALDVTENEDEYSLQASLPGVSPDDIDINFEKDVLTIKGESESKGAEDVEGRRYHLRERRFGSFCRSIRLPNSVDAENIEANYEAGVLSLRLPKLEAAKPKRIEVKTLENSKIIEG